MYINVDKFTCFIQLLLLYTEVDGDSIEDAVHYAKIAFDDSPVAKLILHIHYA